MALDARELDRMADDLYKDRRIQGSIYCGTCGYNLKTLPYVYTCPECGVSYNARPLAMKGIFVPYEASIPLGDFFFALLCATATGYLVWRGVAAKDTASLVIAAFLLLLFLALVDRAVRRFHRFHVAHKIAQRIADAERDS